MKLTRNTILITGGTSGIGRGLAQAFHKLGNKVIIAGRRKELLEQITLDNPGMEYIQLDVAEASSLAEAVEQIRSRFPSLNVFIANAGISRPENFNAEQIETATAEELIQTNVISVIKLTASLLPLLKVQPKSTLMATSSGAGFVPSISYPTYSATKAFLHNWLESLRFQLRETSVEVLELVPPYVQTELTGKAQATDAYAMPLKDFIEEVMAIPGQGTTVKGEVLVTNSLPIRWAEKDGVYDQLLGSF